MNNFIKNILLLVVVLILSYYTAIYFGVLYDIFTPGALDSGAWIGTLKAWQAIIGFPFAYIFFTTLLFQTFAWGNRNKWTGWLLAPAFLFFAAGDLKHIYIPIILALIAWIVAKLIGKLLPNNLTN